MYADPLPGMSTSMSPVEVPVFTFLMQTVAASLLSCCCRERKTSRAVIDVTKKREDVI